MAAYQGRTVTIDETSDSRYGRSGRMSSGGYWMDFPEEHWPPLLRDEYAGFPRAARAQMECWEQLLRWPA